MKMKMKKMKKSVNDCENELGMGTGVEVGPLGLWPHMDHS